MQIKESPEKKARFVAPRFDASTDAERLRRCRARVRRGSVRAAHCAISTLSSACFLSLVLLEDNARSAPRSSGLGRFAPLQIFRTPNLGFEPACFLFWKPWLYKKESEALRRCRKAASGLRRNDERREERSQSKKSKAVRQRNVNCGVQPDFGAYDVRRWRMRACSSARRPSSHSARPTAAASSPRCCASC